MLIMLHTNNLQKMHIASLTWIDSQIEDCVNVKVTDCLHSSLTSASSLIIEMTLASNVMVLPLSEFISAIIGVVTSTRIDFAEGNLSSASMTTRITYSFTVELVKCSCE